PGGVSLRDRLCGVALLRLRAIARQPCQDEKLTVLWYSKKEKSMLDKIEELERSCQELEALLSDPVISGNQTEFRKLSREQSDLSPLVHVYRRSRKVMEEIGENSELLADPEMKDMAAEELNSLEEEKSRLDSEI